MRIDPNMAVLPIKTDSQPKAKTSDTSKATDSTVVTLSAGATASAASKPVDVTGRLEKIKALLDKGDYPVNLDKLASRIVDDDASQGQRHGIMTPELDQIGQLGEELRQAFADERAAIAKLDHARLTQLADHKRQICDQLVALRDRVSPSPEIHDLFVAIQVEARATAMLAAAATEAVRTLLGTEATGYDRRARTTAMPALRLLATY